MTSILAFFLLICVLVFVHEYGHFWAARRCNVKVIRFSIGFGKVLWQKKDKQGTEFAFSLIPLGGYVQMYNGETEFQFPPEQSLNNKTVLQRAFIVLAGPMANFLFAIVAYWVVFVAGISTIKPVISSVIPNTIAAQAGFEPEFQITEVSGKTVRNWEEVTLALIGHIGEKQVEIAGHLVDKNVIHSRFVNLAGWDIDANRENPITALGIRPKMFEIEPQVKQVVEGSPAEKAGILADDKIISINSEPFDWYFLLQQVKKGEFLELVVERSGAQKSFNIQPVKSEDGKRYVIGIVPSYQPMMDKYRTELKYDMLTAIGKSLEKVGSLIHSILQFIGKLLTGGLSLDNMGGPISMAKGAGATAEIGWVYYIGFMALISVNLGVMNLFPILPLDGGLLLLLAGEAILGKPLPEKMRMVFQQLGFVFIVGLMAFALLNDLIHF
ncbi:RIP metalloprotease RseP [Vespertiliibacter pulmonis]|uniref:Zinc metalloprotease n=1 Tax=Vespertiliibacter pulmonis TaxID=1443036 RepID=A0A3N4WJS4_9PAST|nr:RIP metalloprotease RseP [Vespertiliibacter pulmonis]QLB20214.1 RIP metalloprotease RseP [Vespertiliibacter pulmonis]RPE86190.1 regulator of sigma E protease [Vespertiliibacter pulmonis]